METDENENENENYEKEEQLKKKKEKQKESLITFAKLNKYFIIPFLCPIICMICNYFINEIIGEIGFENRKFLLSTFVEITYIGGGLVYFITWIREKTDETRNNAQPYNERERKTSIVYIYNDGENQKNNLKKFGIVFFISLCVTLFTVCDIYSIDKNIFEERLYFLFFISIFSKFILKNNIFKHQYLSLLIAFVGLVLLFIPIALIITKDDIIINICIFITSIGYALFLVLIKYLMIKYYLSPYLCSLYIGIISTILNIIGFMIYSLIHKGNLGIIKDNFNFEDVSNKTKLIIFFILNFISASILQTLSNLVIYYFTPTLLMVTDSISPMLFWMILVMPYETKTLNIVFYLLGYIITLFASLIYNEIIIFNFWDLNENTNKYIDQRGKNELISLRDSENESKGPNLNHDANSSFDEENEDGKSN